MKKRKKDPTTKTAQRKRIRRLMNKCGAAWAKAVKKRAGHRCQACGGIPADAMVSWFCTEEGNLNAHHVESRYNCRALRFDVRNGLCLCPFHHKFGQDSAHKSFCFLHRIIPLEDVAYLHEHRHDSGDMTSEEFFTEEYLTKKLAELEQLAATEMVYK